ncbi:hypothetical protein GEMRC1_005097 [Eukaryota sp. GEM-RC1]
MKINQNFKEHLITVEPNHYYVLEGGDEDNIVKFDVDNHRSSSIRNMFIAGSLSVLAGLALIVCYTTRMYRDIKSGIKEVKSMSEPEVMSEPVSKI